MPGSVDRGQHAHRIVGKFDRAQAPDAQHEAPGLDPQPIKQGLIQPPLGRRRAVLGREEIAITEDRAALWPGTAADREVDIVLIGRGNHIGARQDEPLNSLFQRNRTEESGIERAARAFADLVIVAVDPDQHRHLGKGPQGEAKQAQIERIANPDHGDILTPD